MVWTYFLLKKNVSPGAPWCEHVFYFVTRCENVGKPKRAGCGKKSRGAERKTYYGEKRKNKQTDDEITKQNSKDEKTYYGEKKKTGQRVEEKKRKTDDEITKEKRRIRTDKKSGWKMSWKNHAGF